MVNADRERASARSTRRRITRLSTVVACFAIAATSGACAAILGFERLSEEGADAASNPDGASDAADSSFEAGPACSELGVPAQPPPSDAGADGPESILVAVNLLDFGIQTTDLAGGFNLDRTCSPTVAESTCATRIDEETYNKYARDKNEVGLDNSGRSLLGYLALLGAAFQPFEINERLKLGEFGAVIRIRGYNGLPDDDEVVVEIFPAIGTWRTLDDGGLEKGPKPEFAYGDLWRRDRRFQNVVDASRLKSATAWVRGGRLVASFQSVTLPLSVPEDPKLLDVIIQEGWVSASLVSDGTNYRLSDGVLGGRWRTADILDQVRQIYIDDTVGIKDRYLCEKDLPFDVYGAVKKEVCDGRDLRSSSRDDKKNLPCDAVSTGIRFDSYAVAEAGAFDDPAVIPPRCQQDGAVPAGDDCAPAAGP